MHLCVEPSLRVCEQLGFLGSLSRWQISQHGSFSIARPLICWLRVPKECVLKESSRVSCGSVITIYDLPSVVTVSFLLHSVGQNSCKGLPMCKVREQTLPFDGESQPYEMTMEDGTYTDRVTFEMYNLPKKMFTEWYSSREEEVECGHGDACDMCVSFSGCFWGITESLSLSHWAL